MSPTLSPKAIAAIAAKHAPEIARDFVRAGDLARALRREKSDHPWTDAECQLLAALCDVLHVSGDEDLAQREPRKPHRKGGT